jgi:hypothetical protein
MQFVFKRTEHYSGGWNGWLPEKQRYVFEPGTSLTVAHDVFEHHFPKDYGQMNFELQAVGAAYYVREEHRKVLTYQPPLFSAVWNGIFDIMFSFYANFLHKPLWLDPVKKCKPIDNEEAEEQFAEVVRKGLSDERVESLLSSYRKSFDPGSCAAIIERLKTDSVHWMRRGYNFAANRFRNTDRCTLGWAFYALMDKVNDIYKYAEWTEAEGDKLIVNFNTNRPDLLHVKLVTVYEQERKLYGPYA